MELFDLVVIFIVFVVSAATLVYIYINSRGKTYNEVMAEKRQFADELYANQSTGAAQKNARKNNNKNNKTNVNNKKKSNKEKAKQQPTKVVVEQESSTPTSEQEQESDSAGESPEHYRQKKSGSIGGGHVEFIEAEIISDSDAAPVKRLLTAKGKKPVRKNSASKPPGTSILVKKSNATVASDSIEYAVLSGEELHNELPPNHFEDIHPKDEYEILRANQLAQVNAKSKPKEQRVKRETVKEPAEKIEKAEKSLAAPAKEKINKKKKSDTILKHIMTNNRGEYGVDSLILLLSKAELTRSEYQHLIDFLLNKQQDTRTGEHSEWSEGRADAVQKLKKQLAEKETALSNEQEALGAMQNRMREMRLEINTERSQHNAILKSVNEDLSARKSEVQTLTADIQFMNEKLLNEKQALTVQLQSLQAKLLQEKKCAAQIQQLTESNNLMNKELIKKNAVINELNEQFQKFANEKHKFGEDTIQKLSEYEKKLSECDLIIRQKNDQQMFLDKELDGLRQRVQEIEFRENDFSMINAENKRMRGEMARCKDDYDKLLTMQQYEIEQLKLQVAEHGKAVKMDDSNKVEILNLQNALDSSRNEMKLLHVKLTDGKVKEDELHAQVHDLKGQVSIIQAHSVDNVEQLAEVNGQVAKYTAVLAEKEAKIDECETQAIAMREKQSELMQQVEEQKDKNNDLRSKNWKLVEALKTAENETNSKKLATGMENNGVSDDKITADAQQYRQTKELFQKLFPNAPVFAAGQTHHYDQWVEQITIYVQDIIKAAATNGTDGERAGDGGVNTVGGSVDGGSDTNILGDKDQLNTTTTITMTTTTPTMTTKQDSCKNGGLNENNHEPKDLQNLTNIDNNKTVTSSQTQSTEETGGKI